MKQELEIFYILNKGDVPKSFTIVKHQLEYISNKQIEDEIAIKLGAVAEWWS